MNRVLFLVSIHSLKTRLVQKLKTLRSKSKITFLPALVRHATKTYRKMEVALMFCALFYDADSKSV
jgi:hypothetical protein